MINAALLALAIPARICISLLHRIVYTLAKQDRLRQAGEVFETGSAGVTGSSDLSLFRLERNRPPNLLDDFGFSVVAGVLVPESFSPCTRLMSRACLTASCARFRSCELEKNVANPTQIDKPPTLAPCSSSIRSAISARFRASLCGARSTTNVSWCGGRLDSQSHA